MNDRTSNPAGKINTTLLFIATLFLLAIALGFGSWYWAYSAGSEALKGVRKPDDNPTKKLTGKLAEAKQEKPRFLNEKAIIDRLKKEQSNTAKKVEKQPEKAEKNEKEETKTKEIETTDSNSGFPLIAQKNNVTLEVFKVIKEGSSLTLSVNLKNESSQTVKFLYSFLEIKDDRDRALSAITDGLPSEIPANSENFSGTIRIPTALLDEVNNLSLVLTDYPDQKIELKIDKIPVEIQ